MNKQDHWEKIYDAKAFTSVSWFQEEPKQSLELILACNCSYTDAIIDVGGGESYLCDRLWESGYRDLHLLDISAKALDRAKKRHEKAGMEITYHNSDILDFGTVQKFAVWHDRACFHFLRELDHIETYIQIAASSIRKNACLIISAFALDGPEMCSGLEVSRYGSEDLSKLFAPYFEIETSEKTEHVTPSGGVQRFICCKFRRTSFEFKA